MASVTPSRKKCKRGDVKARDCVDFVKERNVDNTKANYEDSDSDTEEDSSSSSQSDEDELINLDFEAHNPAEEDFHGIRQLLMQLFLKSNIDLSEMASAILSQTDVGSVIKQCVDNGTDNEGSADDDVNHVFGVITCLCLDSKKECCYVSQLKDHLSNKLSTDKNILKKFRDIIDHPNNQIGLLINERFVNIPPTIAVPSFDSLQTEIKESIAKGSRSPCSHYILVAKKFKLKSVEAGKKRKKEQVSTIYTNAEEELFADKAEFKFTYSVKEERDTGVTKNWSGTEDEQYEPLREVLIISASKLPDILKSVRAELGTMQ